MQVIDPDDIEPTVNLSSAEHRDGRQVHRRILSRLRGGPASIDIGFNRSATGLDYAVPYAYNRDEYCYTVAGCARMQSDGEAVDFAAGMFMWRPVGAATQRFTVTSPYNSICAFSPARTEAWGHLLPPAQIRDSAGMPNRPRPQFRNPADVAQLATTEPGVTHRVMFDTPGMEFSHIALTSGVRARLSETHRDQVYYLEAGALFVSGETGSADVGEGQFLFVPSDENFDVLEAKSDSTLIRWSTSGA